MIGYARRKFGVIGEVTMTGLISIFIFCLGALGTSFGYTYMTTSKLEEQMVTHKDQQAIDKNSTDIQLSAMNTKIDLLLKDRGIKQLEISSR